jgi:hypothetical protein
VRKCDNRPENPGPLVAHFLCVIFAFLCRTRLGIHVKIPDRVLASIENQFVGESIELERSAVQNCGLDWEPI